MSTREALLDAPDRDAYLAHHSGLPGPRANLALAAEASDVASAEEASRWAASDDEYLALCGAMATARLGDDERLRQLANDDRWRVREGVVLGLQRHRAGDRDALLRLLDAWAAGTALERRAAVATLAEPPCATRRWRGPRSTSSIASRPAWRRRPTGATRASARSARRSATPGASSWRPARRRPAPASRRCWPATIPTSAGSSGRTSKKARLERLDAEWVASLRARAAA